MFYLRFKILWDKLWKGFAFILKINRTSCCSCRHLKTETSALRKLEEPASVRLCDWDSAGKTVKTRSSDTEAAPWGDTKPSKHPTWRRKTSSSSSPIWSVSCYRQHFLHLYMYIWLYVWNIINVSSKGDMFCFLGLPLAHYYINGNIK